ncbi:hypothetical protein [Cloacibacterium sp.]|uniref:hypothetical protein n=1 Tax=Cloacibacterium sp. TaxID=1913682 RepID=UPI0035B40888
MGLDYTIQKTVFIDDNEVSSQFIVIDENEINPSKLFLQVQIFNYLLGHVAAESLKKWAKFHPFYSLIFFI